MAAWAPAVQANVRGASRPMRMALLTVCFIGIQFTWGVEMTYITPYLLGLGMTKSRTSLVWMAGPLSGIVVAPLVGVMADRSRSRFGRRRPFIVLGSLSVVLCLLILGWAKEVVAFFVNETASHLPSTYVVMVAVVSFYGIDFSINVGESASDSENRDFDRVNQVAVMWSCRSLVVDILPVAEQQSGAAWSSRMAAVGNLLGCLIGTLDLVQLFGSSASFGDTQFKKLIIIAASGLLLCISVTCWAVTEQVSDPDAQTQGANRSIIKHIIATMMNLPPRMRGVCWAQFWSWIGWFLFFSYSTTWVGETYYRHEALNVIQHSKDAVGDMGRVGTTALVVFACVSLVGTIALPFVVQSPEEEVQKHGRSLYKPSLLTAWLASHLLFAFSMFLTPFAVSFRFATLLVALCGLPSAIVSWAPFAFTGLEVNKSSRGADAAYHQIPSSNIELDTYSGERSPHLSPHLADPTSRSTSQDSGIYFGILNIFSTLPQFLGTFLAMIVFSIVEPGKSPELAGDVEVEGETEKVPTRTSDGVSAIAVCLFLGALGALGAALVTNRMRKSTAR